MDRAMAAIPQAEWGPAAWTQLCYEIKTFLLAGHETSAAMLTFALFELTQHPHVLAKGVCESFTAQLPVPLPWTRDAACARVIRCLQRTS